MIKVSTTGMVVSLKTDLRFPIPGQQGHGGRIIHLERILQKFPKPESEYRMFLERSAEHPILQTERKVAFPTADFPSFAEQSYIDIQRCEY